MTIPPQLALFLVGLAWALTIPLSKMAVEGGHQPLGLIFWLKVVGLAVLSVFLVVLRRPFPDPRRHAPVLMVVALVGTVLPGASSFWAATELPAGIMAILIAVVPMFALPIALMSGLERFDPRRLAGVMLGAVAVVMIAAPEASLPPGTRMAFVAIALIAPFCYGVEANYLAVRGNIGLDPVQMLWAATVYSVAFSLPLAVLSGQFIDPLRAWTTADWAVVGVALCDSVAYAGYIWIVSIAGSVFASQVAYLVTGCGMIWAMLLLGERYPPSVWLACLLMLVGVALVQPRRGAGLTARDAA